VTRRKRSDPVGAHNRWGDPTRGPGHAESRRRQWALGPGTGYYAPHVAHWLAEGVPQGNLDVLDVQQGMLDRTPSAGRGSWERE